MTTEAVAQPVSIAVTTGRWLQMQGERWFLCDDVNLTLSPAVTKIGLALAPFDYFIDEGADPQKVRTFTLRQYWQDQSRPSLDFTRKTISEMLVWIEKNQGLPLVHELRPIIEAGTREFARIYHDFDKDTEALMGHGW